MTSNQDCEHQYVNFNSVKELDKTITENAKYGKSRESICLFTLRLSAIAFMVFVVSYSNLQKTSF